MTSSRSPFRIFLYRYRLLRLLSHSGAAEVFEAYDEHLCRPIVLKIVSETPHTDPRVLERLRVEAQALRRIHHPNVVEFHAYGCEDRKHFLAMQSVEGDLLTEILSRGRIPVSRALTWLEGLLAGVDAVHASGLVHGDINPANIYVKCDNSIVLANLSLGMRAAADRPCLTTPGLVIGIIDYLAPEIIDGKSATVLSDLYSVGVVIQEVLTGGPTLEERLPSSENPEIPKPLETVVMKLCHRNPASRYASAREAIKDLEERGCLPVNSREKTIHFRSSADVKEAVELLVQAIQARGDVERSKVHSLRASPTGKPTLLCRPRSKRPSCSRSSKVPTVVKGLSRTKRPHS